MSQILSTDAIRAEFAKFQTAYGDEAGTRWRARYRATVDRVRQTPEADWMTEAFQRLLWEDGGVSGIGPGSSVSVAGGYADKDLAAFLLELRDIGLPEDTQQAAVVLQGAYDEILSRVRPKYTEKRPRARIARLLAALYPQHMTCLMDDRRTYQVHGLIGAAKAPTNWIGQNPLIRARLREALEGLGGEDVDHAMFSWFLWESHFAKPDSGAAEAFGSGREPVDVPEFSILPASSQRRSLFALKNNIGLLVSVVRESEQGISKDDLLEFIRQESPNLAETSATHVINQAMGGGLGLLRFSNGAYFPTDRGFDLLTAPDPSQVLRAPIVGRIFGVAHLLLKLREAGGMAQQDATRYVQSLVPTWTTTMPASYIVLWSKMVDLVVATQRDGKSWLTLTDDGDDYAAALPADFLTRWRIADDTLEDASPEPVSSAASAPVEKAFTPYAVADIVSDGCFLTSGDLDGLLALLRHKKNLVLQGPPGTGKTWLARRLAYALVGTKDPSRVTAVQFQPSLSYEDFVRGWRPHAGKDGIGGLRLTDGVFLECVTAALTDPEETYVLVIEEINRGNPAQILGELLTLLETDKRDASEALRLAYPRHADERVHIPPNLHIIGTMNIADRSLALVDLALRRRFAFRNLTPQLNDAWRAWCQAAGAPGSVVDLIAQRMAALNGVIGADSRLGEQFCVGHSYVTPPKGGMHDWSNWYRTVVETEIGPLLDEYWYDDPAAARQNRAALVAGL